MTSEAHLKTEIAELRRRLWLLIAIGKQIAHQVEAKDRARLLREMMESEKHLTGGIHA